MSTVLSMDPGMSTGAVAAKIMDDELPTIIYRKQIEGGLASLSGDPFWTYGLHQERTVCEQFHPRPMSRTYRLDELEPLRIEGYLLATLGWGEILFRQPEQRHLFKETETFTKSAAFLKWAGYWTVGSEVGCKDANDANSAMMHLFGYLRDRKHRPTISLLLDYQRSITEEGTS